MIVAPATANVLCKMAHGIADDALTTTFAAMRKPVVIAPAMNTNMYDSPATQEAIRMLSAWENITMVDIGDRNDIRLDWNNQITLLLGNDSNLRYEIAAAASTLPRVFEKHGKTVTGQLDLSQYSNPAITAPAIVFTPSALLETKPTQEQ